MLRRARSGSSTTNRAVEQRLAHAEQSRDALQAELAQRGQELKEAQLRILHLEGAPAAREHAARARELEDARALGVDIVACARFDAEFAAMSADRFITDLLERRLDARHILVGEDFRFGRGRTGDVALLRAHAAQRGVDIAPLPEICVDGARVSSTRVRRALADGRPDQAARLLGHSYRVSGRVVTGERLGRTLGFPTLNIRLARRPAPRYGVYAVEVGLADGG